ncbi:MAG: hypothetical protein QOE00_2635 [Ilumatobacteraceae bacterium]|jgi:hypothetical protein
MVTLWFHLEVAASHDDTYWWIDSPDAPNVHASAPTLLDCRSLAIDALQSEGIDTSDVRGVLIDCGSLSKLDLAEVWPDKAM